MAMQVTEQPADGGTLRLVVGTPSAFGEPVGAWRFMLAPDPDIDTNVRIACGSEGVPVPGFAPHELNALLEQAGFEEARSNAGRLEALLAAVWELGPRVGHVLDRHAVAEVDLGTDVMEVWVPVLTAV